MRKPLYSVLMLRFLTALFACSSLAWGESDWLKTIENKNIHAVMSRYEAFFEKNGASWSPAPEQQEAYRELKEEVSAKGKKLPVQIIFYEGVEEHLTLAADKLLGRGRSKSIYDLGNGKMIALTNAPHITFDELMVTSYIQSLGVHTTELQPAVLRWKKDKQVFNRAVYAAPTFDSYAPFAFPIELKYPEIRFNRDRLPSSKTFDTHWNEFLQPMAKDISTLIHAGFFTFNKDTLSLILVSKGHPWHSKGEAPWEARLFLFDFSKGDKLDKLPYSSNASSAEHEITFLRWFIAGVRGRVYSNDTDSLEKKAIVTYRTIFNDGSVDEDDWK